GAPGETAMPEPEDTATRQCAVRKQLIRILILWFTASIYIWSAWSKLDASFIQSHGPKFVLAILDAVGISTRFWSEENWQLAAVMLPIIELVVGVGLLFRRIRGFALLASLLMHLLLIVAVGPWGLDHSPAVLLWNGFFIAQNVILFVSGRRADATAGVSGSESVNETHTDANPASAPRPNFAIAVTVAVILIPALRSVGCCDAWPAWAVYASSPARVLVQVRNDSVDRQPKSLRKYVESRKINDGWSWLRIDLWSLNATGTPIYPADRFQFAIARSIWEDSQFPNSIRVVQESDADRMTGKRDRTQVIDESEIAEFGTRFRLNSMPR
ncbi:MAG: hypothetical protein O3B13_14190, partial [Planctomycetota bacterium]|nr:hypothetical protein [Planctomycetota bacterium]